MLEGMRLFKMGFSWGGYESLIIPFDPRATRTASGWPHGGPCLRLHCGLERVDDLLTDRSRLRQAQGCGLTLPAHGGKFSVLSFHAVQ